jgi:hypothetical protein
MFNEFINVVILFSAQISGRLGFEIRLILFVVAVVVLAVKRGRETFENVGLLRFIFFIAEFSLLTFML